MDIRAVAFDVNGTLIHIRTEDDAAEVFRAAGHLLTYQGIDLRRQEVRESYLRHLREQRRASPEEHPEFDAVEVWRAVVEEHATAYTRSLPAAKIELLPLFLAEMTRGIARRRLRLYPHVRQVLRVLRDHFPLALVTDAQSAWARGELHRVGILDWFDPIVVSGDHGYRKPDPRLFQLAVDGLGVPARNTLYVGNDMYRDIHGAQQAGMRTVMFDSDQGTKQYRDCVPDRTVVDWRDLLDVLDLPGLPRSEP